MARPIGERIKQVVAIVDELGQANANEVLERMAGVCKHNVGKYCSRAVGLGLMTADRSAYRVIYRVTEGWREKLANRQPAKKPEPPVLDVAKTIKTQPNSVFALGSR